MEYGKILIDNKDNYLLYGDDAVIVNVSAFSIKKLYAEHSISLLARNLRYHIKGKNEKRVDDGISKTIKESPENFWLKNNGLTMICDDFQIDGREVKLRNFSIVNGGQTTYMISQSEHIDARHDLWLLCKIIKIKGETEDSKKNFVLEIAEATNSQKPINEEDLKANSPEQIRFAKAMFDVGVFYQNKRGESPPSKYRAVYRRTKMADIGKWCLAAIFQEPGKSRTDPKTYFFDKKYYDVIFNRNQEQIAHICKELLYIDYYFEKKFKPKFKKDNEDKPNSADRNKIANFAERFCLAFVTLAARFHQGNIIEKDLSILTDENVDSGIVNKILIELGEMNFLIPMEINTEEYNTALDKLFKAIINAGAKFYSRECRSKSVELTNLIKTDRRFYYAILKDYWDDLEPAIEETFRSLKA